MMDILFGYRKGTATEVGRLEISFDGRPFERYEEKDHLPKCTVSAELKFHPHSIVVEP